MTPDKRQKNGAESPQSPEMAQEASVVKDGANSQGRAVSPRSDGGLEEAKRETDVQRAKRLSDCPSKYRGLYRKAWEGKSRKAAIRAHCLECVGYSEAEVRLCTAPACSFFEFRLKG